MPGRSYWGATVPTLALLAIAGWATWPTASALARPSASPAAAVRHCGHGAFEEYPWFDIRATDTTCGVARRLIRTLLSHPVAPPGCNRSGVCWSMQGNVLHGRWTSRSGWRCTARIPPAISVDGRPFGSESCQRGAARVTAESAG